MMPALIVPSVRPRASILAGTLVGTSTVTTQQLSLRQYLIGGGYIQSNVGVSWSSGNRSIATVDGNGLVTFLSTGTNVAITATASGISTTVTLNGIAQSNAAIVAALNASGPAQVFGLFIAGVNDTVVPDGTSFTGFRKTQWNDAVNSSLTNYWRPTSGFTGAPCLANGAECGEGLEIPASAVGALARDITTLTAVGQGTALYDGFFADGSKGIEITHVGALSAPLDYALIGENDGSGLRYRGEDQRKQYHVAGTGRAPANAVVSHGVYSGAWLETGTPVVFRDPGTNKRIVRWFVNRDLVSASTPYEYNWPDLGAGGARRIRSYPASVFGSTPATTSQPTLAKLITSGRMNKAQRRLWNDWWEVQPWASGRWADTALGVGYHGGDSYQEPQQAPDIYNGVFAGAPAFGNYAVSAEWATNQTWGFDTGTGLARAAMDPKIYNYPVLQWTAAEIDTSKRSAYAFYWGEFVNLNNESDSEATNYYMMDRLLSLDPKFRAALMESSLGNNGGSGLNNALNLSLESHAVPAHATSLSREWRMTPNTPEHYGPDREPNKKSYIFWNSSDTSQDITQHPLLYYRQYVNAEYRNQLRRCFGADVSQDTSWVQPSVVLSTLSAGATLTPSWTPRNVDLTALSKSLTFTSLRPFVASVDASTGLITAVQGGVANIQALTSDGAVGISTVLVSSPTAAGYTHLTDTFGGSNGSLVGNADTGQPVAMKIGTWKVDGSNHLYLDTPQPSVGVPSGTFETMNRLLRDTGLVDGTFKVQIATAVNDDLRFYFRMTDLNNGWCLQHGGNGTWFLFKLENEIFCVRHPEISIRAPVNGDWIEVVTSGTSITANLRDSSLALLGTKSLTDSWNDSSGARFAGPGMGWLNQTPKFASLSAA